MARRYRTRRRQSSDDDFVSSVIVPAFVLYAGYLLLLYFTNRTSFWLWVAYGAIGIIGITAVAIGYMKWKAARKRRRIQKLIESTQKAGMEEQVKNFFIRFGMGQERSKHAWEYRGYKIDWNRFNNLRQILSEKGLQFETSDVSTLLRYYIDEREYGITSGSIQGTTKSFKSLSGADFEALLLRLYEKMGYTVQHSGKTGDQGGDLVAMKGEERLLIQAKCYNDRSVGNDAVQQAFAAKTFYNCNKATVITTSEFTREAIELSKTNSVELISKTRLQQLLLDQLQESWN